MPYVTSAERIGMKKGSKDAILDILDERFGNVPLEIINHINNIENDKKLKSLLRFAVRCNSIDEFRQSIIK